MRMHFLKKVVLVFAFIAIFSFFIAPYTTNERTALAATPKKVAILFGMADYDGTENDLRGPVNDMIALGEILKRCGYTVYTYTDYTAADLLSTVQTKASSLSSVDTLLFAYSGHGSDGGYLVGSDLAYISVSDLESKLSLHSGVKEVIIDACYSGDFISKEIQPDNFVSIKSSESFNDYIISVFAESESALATKDLAKSGYYVLTASSGSQVSYEHLFNLESSTFAADYLIEYPGYPGCYVLGNFSIYFHDGFGAYNNPPFSSLWADYNYDYKITWNEIYNFTKELIASEQQVQVYPLNSNHLIFDGVRVYGVDLSASEINVEFGQSVTLYATVHPEDADNQSLLWDSDNEDIATVEDGVVTGVKRGTAIITVTTVDGNYTESCEVTVLKEYDIDPSTGTLLKYYGSDVNVVIPSEIDGIAVRIIGEEAFKDMSQIESITVPEGVTTLARSAFSGMANSLQAVTLPESLITIGEYAFSSSYQLTSISIPSNVETIGELAFSNCIRLTSINIPASVTTIVGRPFVGCDGLVSIEVSPDNPNYKSVDGVLFTKDGTELIEYPCNKSGSSYSIPSGTVFTAMSSFSFCNNLLSVTFPDGFVNLGIYTFEDCEQITSFTFGNSLETIGFGAFRGCISLSSITIPETVTTLGGSAFSRCSALDSIIIPPSIKVISEYAFRSCEDLTSVTISEGVEDIKEFAFSICVSLTSINIPKTVTSIEPTVFLDCSSLLEITVDPENSDYKSESGILFSKDGTLLLSYPIGKTDNSYTIPSGVIAIEDYAFHTANLTEVFLPDGTESIGISTFSECSSLEKIVIPASVTSIGNYCFSYCSELSIYGEDGSYAETYAIANDIPFFGNNARLSDLTINGDTIADFSESVYTYNVSVYYEMTAVQIGATASNTNSQITGDTGTKNLTVGLNTFTVVCTAGDGTTQKEYVLNITRNEILNEFTTSVYSINRTRSLLTDVADECSLADFRDNFSNSPGFIKIFKPDGTEVTDGFVGTGMIVKLIIDDIIKDELTIFVLGDVSGDGTIDIIDYTYVKLHIFEVMALVDIQFDAGDVNESGIIDIIDYTYIKLDIFDIASIN